MYSYVLYAHGFFNEITVFVIRSKHILLLLFLFTTLDYVKRTNVYVDNTVITFVSLVHLCILYCCIYVNEGHKVE